jgi:hypothetical protein
VAEMKTIKTIEERLNNTFATMTKREQLLISSYSSVSNGAKQLWSVWRNIAWTNDGNYYDPSNNYYVTEKIENLAKYFKKNVNTIYVWAGELQREGWAKKVRRGKYKVINPYEWTKDGIFQENGNI